MNEDKKVAATTASAIGLSAFASFVGLCCIGPWTVTLLGVSGAVAMARWQPYRTYILVVAVGMLSWAFWRVYRRQAACPDQRCAAGSAPWLKAFLWLAVALLVLAFFTEQLQWFLIDPTPAALQHG